MERLGVGCSALFDARSWSEGVMMLRRMFSSYILVAKPLMMLYGFAISGIVCQSYFFESESDGRKAWTEGKGMKSENYEL